MSHINIPTATVLITGLAICKKSRDPMLNKWEVLFFNPVLPNKDHILKLEVLRISQAHPMGERVFPPRVVSGRRIAIDTLTPQGPFESEHAHANGLIDREDTAWCIDFKAIHPNADLFPNKPADITDLSYLTVEYGQFYTSQRTPRSYRLRPAVGPDVFARKLTDVLAANIECQDGGEIRLMIDGQIPPELVTNPLMKQPGIRYEIILSNLCSCESQEIDFENYYKIFEVPAADRLTLEEELVFRTLEAACNPVKGDPNCNLELYYTQGKCI